MSRREVDVEALREGVLAGEKRAVARAITLVENRDPEAYQLVAMLPGQAPQPRSLGPQHQSRARRRLGLGQGHFALGRQAQAPESSLFQGFDGPGEVDYPDQGQDVQGPGGRLGQSA